MAEQSDMTVSVTTVGLSNRVRALFWFLALPTAVVWLLLMLCLGKLLLGFLTNSFEV